MSKNHEIFLQYLDDTFGTEDEIHQAEAMDGGPPVSVFVYYDIPEEGMITGVTYGLSAASHPAWKVARPEMVISVSSEDVGWPCAAATMVAHFRGQKSFSYGDVFATDLPLAEDSQMDTLLVFAQSILEPDYATLQVDDYRIVLAQFYPIYKSELDLYQRIGLERFWKHQGFDMYDVRRPPITSG